MNENIGPLENVRPKRQLADAMLDNTVLKRSLEKDRLGLPFSGRLLYTLGNGSVAAASGLYLFSVNPTSMR